MLAEWTVSAPYSSGANSLSMRCFSLGVVHHGVERTLKKTHWTSVPAGCINHLRSSRGNLTIGLGGDGFNWPFTNVKVTSTSTK